VAGDPGTPPPSSLPLSLCRGVAWPSELPPNCRLHGQVVVVMARVQTAMGVVWKPGATSNGPSVRS
jgi:hypothetical protein